MGVLSSFPLQMITLANQQKRRLCNEWMLKSTVKSATDAIIAIQFLAEAGVTGNFNRLLRW
jgi:hypothetical protein